MIKAPTELIVDEVLPCAMKVTLFYVVSSSYQLKVLACCGADSYPSVRMHPAGGRRPQSQHCHHHGGRPLGFGEHQQSQGQFNI